MKNIKTGNIFNPQIKLLWHWKNLNDWLQKGDTVPILIEISLTNYCNASCPWCFYRGTYSSQRISRPVMLGALEDIARTGVKAISWTGGGEPTLHPNFLEFSKTANRFGLKQGLFTNALSSKLNRAEPKFFDWIRISLTEKYFDGIDKKLLKKYVNSGTKIGICMNLTPENHKVALEMAKKSKKAGVNYFQVRPALAKTHKEQPYLEIPYFLKDLETDRFKIFLSEYKFTDCQKPRDYDICYGHFFCPVIDFNGDLNVCMYKLGEKPYIFGNLNKRGFAEIWKSSRRKKITKNKLVTNDCQLCCKNHEINKLAYGLKHPSENLNIDFI